MEKILEFFGEPLSYGGQESFIFNSINKMDLSDLKIDVATPYYSDNSLHERIIEKNGGDFFCFGLQFNPGGNRFNIVKRLNELLLKKNYDVIHINSGSISVLAFASLVANKNHIKKIILHSHTAHKHENIKHYLLKMIFMPIFYLCGTDYLSPSLDAAYWQFSKKIASSKIKIVNNGIDLDIFKFNKSIRLRMRANLGVDNETIVIGNVGRISYQKNQEFLIRVLKKMKTKKINCKLLLVGNGDYKKKLDLIIKKFGLNKDVIFTGNVNNVNDYMQAMDVFAFPSRHEGLGIVGIEAQGTGLPVVASKNVPKEMKVTKDVYFLKIMSNEEEWADKIIKLSNAPRSSKTDDLINKGYDIKHTSEILKKIYQS